MRVADDPPTCRSATRAVAGAADASTWVNVKGCNLGQNQRAIDALRELFGGRATVTAPTRSVRNREPLLRGEGEGTQDAAEVIAWMAASRCCRRIRGKEAWPVYSRA